MKFLTENQKDFFVRKNIKVDKIENGTYKIKGGGVSEIKS